MGYIFVVGAWGGGSTEVAGVLNSLGCPSLPPFHQREAQAAGFESEAYHRLLLSFLDEEKLDYKIKDRTKVIDALTVFRDNLPQTTLPFFLQHPLSALILPEISEVFQPRFIFIYRPFKEIEANRLQHKRPAHMGREGAQTLYTHMMRFYVEAPDNILMLRYPGLLKRTRAVVSAIISFGGLKNKAAIPQAVQYIEKLS
ncbi:MAG: hypothetical protein GC184_14350 [Rhizobiales bacterium]|nr:hypothetical protein [Hyphomicrobiales bacterium]